MMDIPFVGGIKKAKDAKYAMEKINQRHISNINRLENLKKSTYKKMDEIGGRELLTLQNLKEFVDIMELIDNRPDFTSYQKVEIRISGYTFEEVKKVSKGAGILLNGMTHGDAGMMGDFAVTGAVAASIKALEITEKEFMSGDLKDVSLDLEQLISLASDANKKAIISRITTALCGATIAGSAILGGPFLGLSLLTGNIFCDIYGNSFSKKADEAKIQMLKEEKEINEKCEYLEELTESAKKFDDSLIVVSASYKRQLEKLKRITEQKKKRNWEEFKEEEKTICRNISVLVDILLRLCSIKLIIKDEITECDLVNIYAVEKNVEEARYFLRVNNLFI